MARITIVGAGISGLSLAFFLKERVPDAEIIVLESEKKPGGKIWTEKVKGYLCEGGVNGFLDNRPKTLGLSEQISLKPLRSNDASRRRFIFSGGRLHRLPESPPAFLTSSLMTLPGRLRVIGEMFVPGRPKDEETLADFARRRLGREAYEKLIDPMASGIYAGNPENLSLRACFPKVYNLEKKYGSLIRGMIRMQREKKRQGSSEKVGAGPGGVLTSFFDGMDELVEALRLRLHERLKTGSRVLGIGKRGKGYVLHLADGSHIETDVAVLACPAYVTAEIVRPLEKRLSGLASEIPYPSLSVVCFGYRKERIQARLDGFGFLIPSREKRKILGTLWDSSIFPNRAPEGHVLLRSMIGGARASELAMEQDSVLTGLVREELDAIMGIAVDPDFVRVFRHKMAIPQYTVGHLERLRSMDAVLEKFSGLYLTGNAYRGIGVNDCIENSWILAEKIVEETL